MKYIEKFLYKRIFDYKYVLKVVGKRSTADMIINSYLKKGYIRRVKKNLYVVTSLENGGTLPNKFEIASNITETSFVSHFSAFEYHGLVNQVSNEVTVSSLEQFRNFSFEYNLYHYKGTKSSEFLEPNANVRVTSIERTIVDCIDDLKSFDDLEELIGCLEDVRMMDVEIILNYLVQKKKKILFSKVGLILSYFKDDYHITNDFLLALKSKGLTVTKYMNADTNRLVKYYKEWKLHSYDIESILGRK